MRVCSRHSLLDTVKKQMENYSQGILLQKYRDRNWRCIAILFKSIGVRGRFNSADCFSGLSGGSLVY